MLCFLKISQWGKKYNLNSKDKQEYFFLHDWQICISF